MVEHPAARVGQRLGLALSGGAVIGAGARRGVGVDEGGDRVEHRRVVEPADQPAPTAAAVALQAQLVDARLGVFVGLGAVGVERLQQLLGAGVQLVGRAVGDPGGQLGLRGHPPLRIEPSGRVGAEHPGDDLDVPHAPRTRVEHGRGGGQPRG